MKNTCCHTPLSSDMVKDVLSSRGINKTKLKIEILKIISKANRPLSIQEIHSTIKGECNLSTVFRTITQFKEKEIVSEVNLDEGFFRYEILNVGPTPTHHHHHHVRCRNCGEIKNLENCDLSAFEKAIAKMGFTKMEHRLEFSALCSKCS